MPHLREIRATWQCEGCGKDFSVSIEPARTTCPEVPSMWDMALDAVRGGIGYQGPNPGGLCCIYKEKVLCASCEDEFVDADEE